MSNLAEEIEDGIFEQLAEGSLKDKKLRKLVLKRYGAAVDESYMEAFRSTLEKLVTERRIIQHNDEVTINKAVPLKRKNNETSEPEKKANKKSKTSDETGGEGKRFDYPEMWKNGERYWKEGAFNPEYLRTNPER